VRLDDKEWWVVAAVFTGHVLLAMILLIIWCAIGVAVFLGIAWLVTKL
jgi:hypothetical protein